MPDNAAPKSASAWPAFAPLLDDPSSHEPAHDHARLGLVVDALERLIRASLSQSSHGRPCIGLLGGLGQGKTSALAQLTVRLGDPKRNPTRYQWLAFDVAHHKPEQLEFEFDRLQASLAHGRVVWRWWRYGVGIALRGMLALVALIAAIWWLWEPELPTLSEKDAKKALGMLSNGVAAALGILFPAWMLKEIGDLRQRAKERHFLIGDHQSKMRAWARLTAWGRSIFCPVDLLVVDNLDRASVAQQRAMLRALYKFKGELPYCVVIAFDETSLLGSSADPEAPRELLDKAIQIMVRLPDRMPFEHLVLAQLALNGLGGETLGAIAAQPRIRAGLAHLLLLEGHASPRRAKRLLNDGLARLAQNHRVISAGQSGPPSLGEQEFRPRVDRLLAMLRVTALTELAPTVRNQPQALIQALTLCTPLSLAPMTAVFAAAPEAAALLAATRLCRPQTGDWRDIVSMALAQSYDRGAEADSSITGVHNEEAAQADLYTRLQGLWNAVDQVARNGDGGELDDQAMAGRHPARVPWVLPVTSIYLSVQPDGAACWRLLDWFRRSLESAPAQSPRWFETGETRMWLSELAFSQSDVHERLGDMAAIRSWLDFAGARQPGPRLALLLLYPPERLSLRDVLRLMDPGVAPVNALVGGQAAAPPIELAVPDCRAWFNQLATTSFHSVGPPLADAWPESRNLSVSVFTIFARAWPSLRSADPGALLAQLEDQAEIFRWMHLNGPQTGFAPILMAENMFSHRRLMQAVASDLAQQKRYLLVLTCILQGPSDVAFAAWQFGPAHALSAGQAIAPFLEGLQGEHHGIDARSSAAVSLYAAMQGIPVLWKFWSARDLFSVLGRDEEFLLLLYQCIELGIGDEPGKSNWPTLLSVAGNTEILRSVFAHVLPDLESREKLRTKDGLKLLAASAADLPVGAADPHGAASG